MLRSATLTALGFQQTLRTQSATNYEATVEPELSVCRASTASASRCTAIESARKSPAPLHAGKSQDQIDSPEASAKNKTETVKKLKRT